MYQLINYIFVCIEIKTSFNQNKLELLIPSAFKIGNLAFILYFYAFISNQNVDHITCSERIFANGLQYVNSITK